MAFCRKRLEAHWAGIASVVLLQGGSGPDKLICFHPSYFSFKPSASVELIMEMVSLASPPIPPLPLMLGLSHCFHSAQCSTVCCCVPGRASSDVTAAGTMSLCEEQQHPAIPHQHPLPKRDNPSGGGGHLPDFHGYQAKTPTGEEVLHSSKTVQPPVLGPRGRGSLGGDRMGETSR